MKTKHSASLAGGVLLLGSVVTACAGPGPGSTSEPSGQSLDALLGGDGGLSVDGGNPCAACIQTSCSTELTVLETELKTLKAEATSAYACVRDSKCLSLFWVDRDAGKAAASAAVSSCIAACEADAGLPAPDAALSAVRAAGSALDACVDQSCASQCPGAANDLDDIDGGFMARSSFDGAFPHCDASLPFHPFATPDGGAFPLPDGAAFASFFGGRR